MKTTSTSGVRWHFSDCSCSHSCFEISLTNTFVFTGGPGVSETAGCVSARARVRLCVCF